MTVTAYGFFNEARISPFMFLVPHVSEIGDEPRITQFSETFSPARTRKPSLPAQNEGS